MANNRIQVKRTSTSGRTPNTTNSGNSQYIAAGEFALNMADGILYSSNGSASIEIGANNTNQNVTGNLTVKAIIANNSIGAEGQTLTSNGSAVYWATGGGSGSVTQVDTGSGLTGGPITTTGTVSILANTGIVANSTGTFVNAAYIGTLTANNANNLDGVAATSYVNTSGNYTLSGNLTFTSGANAIVLSNATSNWVYWDASGATPPTFTTRSAGTKLVLYPALSDVQADYALGIEAATLWSSVPVSSDSFKFKWYGGTTEAASLSGAGQLTVLGSVNAAAYNVGTSFTANSTVVNAVSYYAGTLLVANTTVSNATHLGGTAASGYQTSAGLSANVATLTANNTSFVGSVSAANVVSNAQLTGNLANYVTTTNLTNNLANYQTTAGLSANVATLTANNTNFVGSVSAANVISNAQLTGNLANYAALSGATFTGAVVVSNNLTITGNLTLSGNTVIVGANNLVVQDAIVSLHTPANLSSLTSNDGKNIGLAFHYYDTEDKHALLYRDNATGYLQFHTDGGDPQSNSNPTGNNLGTIQANIFWAGNDSVYATTNSTVYTGTANNTSFVGSVSAANVVSNVQLSGNLANYVTATNLSNNLANYQTTAGLSANVAKLTSNNSTFAFGKSEAALNVNSALTSNNSTNLGGTAAAGYQTTAGLSANVATLTSNNATTAYGKTEGNLNVNSALTANNSTNLGGVAASGYQTSAGLSANVATLTANNSTNLNGQPASFYTNASNITTGALPYAQIPANIVNTTAAFTISGVRTHNANIVIGTTAGISANGGFGTAGHVLHSNGTSVYWAVDDNSGGTVTSVATGNGMTGGAITTTGTVSVLANTGIVANATGTFVNASYIATITANNATFINGNSVLTVMESLRANRALHGGGTITVSASGDILWSARFIVISNGRGTHFSTDGFFNISCPTSGTITGVGGAANKTATAAGIPLGSWEAIYYIMPIGSNSGSLAANFRVVSYTSDVEIPSNWLLICVKNDDNSNYYFNNGIILKAGQSFAGGTFTSANMPLANNATNLNGQAASFYTNASNITTGTLPDARLSSAVINTTAAFTRTGVTTFSANVILNSSGLSANGGFGTAGQVLTTNGTATYWTAAAGGGYYKGGSAAVGTLAVGGQNLFRVNADTLNFNTTIAAGENAQATGPIAVAAGITLTVASGARVAIV